MTEEEYTFVLLKNDCIEGRNVGRVIQKIEEDGFVIETMFSYFPERMLLEQHYQEHSKKPFFESLIKRMENKQVIAMGLKRKDAGFEFRECFYQP